MAEENRSEIDQAYEDIEREVPARMARAIKWLRNPEARWIRIPIGVLFIIAGFLWFLPVVGIEFLLNHVQFEIRRFQLRSSLSGRPWKIGTTGFKLDAV